MLSSLFYTFSVEEVNQLAANGMPFRDAYKTVGLEIEAGEFKNVCSKKGLSERFDSTIGAATGMTNTK